MSRLRRWLKPIDWSHFGHTAHWLRGADLFDYLMREQYMPEMRAQLFDRPSIFPGDALMRRLSTATSA